MVKRRTCTPEWRTTRDTHQGSGFHQTITVVHLITRKLGIACALWAALMTPGVVARSAPVSPVDDQSSLLSVEQGEALVQFALTSGAHLRRKPDCSHLVHLVYSRAGLKYAYQPSRTLYRGAPDFERVKKPQPGDLIVWRGHVGIVVSPTEKTFFSSVRSGIITESWIADQWLARGRPRFYRYRLGPDSNPEMLAALTPDDTPRDRDSAAPADDEITVRGTANAPTGSPLATSSSTPVLASIRQHKKPEKKEIEAAFLTAATANAQQLLDADANTSDFGQHAAFAVFSRADVQKIRIKHDRGSVTIRLRETMSIEQGKVQPERVLDRDFLIERRTNGDSSVWVLTDPQQQIYVPAAKALSVFQHRAEILLHNDPNGSSTRAVIKGLDILYNQPPSSSQRTALK
ncbi:MAG TPA: NlpC/P60 family protein [Candidatus Acidoferrales bacterium]|jgi:hypothetical protein|nr:NlpC/P60 family protein [Candidatus Acidoferrales bacterium]